MVYEADGVLLQKANNKDYLIDLVDQIAIFFFSELSAKYSIMGYLLLYSVLVLCEKQLYLLATNISSLRKLFSLVWILQVSSCILALILL